MDEFTHLSDEVEPQIRAGLEILGRWSGNDIARARDALNAIPAGCERRIWAIAGMAAKAAGLSEDDFISWSRAADNFDGEKDCKSAWKSFKAGDVTEATLFRLALDAGWQDQAKEVRKNGDNGHAKTQERPQATRKTGDKGKRPPFDFAAVWRDSGPAPIDHPYIARKLGTPEGLRVYRGSLTLAGQALDGALLVPVHNAEGELQSWQAIPPDGDKRSALDAPISGGSFVIGGAPRDGEPLFICEGVAQAWSAHQANSRPAVVCFGAGNMQTIAEQMKDRFPDAHLVIVADAGKEGDCERIATDVGGAWIGMPDGSPRNFDANDIHLRDGLQAVADLLTQGRKPEPAPSPFNYISLADLDANPPPKREWIVRDWLPRGTLVSKFGGAGIGKTLLAQQVGTCVGNGVPVFGQPVTRGPVLALFGEDDPDELRRRQRAILAQLGRSPS